MSGTTDTRDALAALLANTRAEELDCDAFLALIAEYVEGRSLGAVAALFEHHREICPECEEELQALRCALGLD